METDRLDLIAERDRLKHNNSQLADALMDVMDNRDKLEKRIGNAVEILDSIRAILRGECDPELYTDRHDAARIVEMINGFLASVLK